MSYINRLPNFLINRKFVSFNIPHSSRKIFKVTSCLTVTNYNPSTLTSCQYSSLVNSRLRLSTECRTLIVAASSLNFASHLSTNGNEDRFQVIITNPSENITSSSEITLNSSEAIVNPSLSADETIRDFATEIVDIAAVPTNVLSVTDVAEPTLASLGLGGWTPVGMLQQWLEYLHISHHMPWWMAIITSTVIARIFLIPLLIKTQKNAISMSNYMPQLQYLQSKFGEARRTGNTMEASRYASEIMMFMKEHNISPLKNALFPLLQAPVFVSFFMGLRSLAKLPVESMKIGGISWTMDLTIPDPYYVLPLVACGTLYVVLKVGAESGVKMENMKMAKYFVRALPVLVLPFCINFPAAILYYWCANNFCTLAIVSVMRIGPIRQFLKLPTQQTIDPRFVVKKKGFIDGIKSSYEDQKVLAAVEDRRRMDSIRFRKAGVGPIPRTYSYDPTKPRPANAASAASCKSQTSGDKT